MILIIDGNYLLHRNIFSLHKERKLYGHLDDSLTLSTKTYSSWFPFKEIFFVSDSKVNWRKVFYKEYKGNRDKSSDIDWEFANATYAEFKSALPKRYTVMEKEMVEGDDWISYLTRYYNKVKKESVLIISNDGDIKQLLNCSPDHINLMVNENFKYDNIYVPEDYKTWLATANSGQVTMDSLFDETESEKEEMIKFIKSLLHRREIKEVNYRRVLLEKIVMGDRGDNIKSVYIKNNRGIGEKTAQKIVDKYYDYFGKPTFNKECFDRVVDIVIEEKKLESNEFDNIKENVLFNNKLVNLYKLPDNIKKMIKEDYENR